MEPILLVQGSLTESDLLSVARYTAWNRSIGMKIMLALACLMMLIGIATVVMGQPGNAVVPLLLGGFYSAYFFVSPKLSVKKQMKSSAHVSQEGRYEFGTDHFSINRPSLNVSMPWSDIHSVVELPDAFAIFTTKMCFFAIPKRFFDAGQLTAFRALIQSTPGKNGKPLCP
jgi:hypothetical protein